VSAYKCGREPTQGTYNYASAIVQHALFTHNPKRSNALALEPIGHYLKGTKNRWLVLQATKRQPDKPEISVQFQRDVQFETATFKTTLHEDHTDALILAKMEPERMALRSKHSGVKYHWFRTKLKPNEIEIDRIDTKLQRADFLTKSLRTKTFEANRKLTMGW
jgi:hypothetical protein